jgi:putative membrane protein
MAGPWTPYCGAGPGPAELWARWNLDPWLLTALTTLGVVLLMARRNDGQRRALALAAWAVLAVGFVSPLCALSSALFAARTVHHVLLAAAAAPLLAWALPPATQGGRATMLLAPPIFAIVFWAWHAPAAYGWALSSNLAYWLMQVSVLGSAVALWRGVRIAAPPAAVAILLGTMVQMGLLGALLVFMPRAIYAPHAVTTAAWDLTPLADQQIAGLIMWAPAAAIYLGAALMILGRWLRPSSTVAARGA